MKLVKALSGMAIIIATSIAPAVAQTKVEILGVNYGGNGCPANSASVSVSPDGQEISILFDRFIAKGNNANEQRKSCNVSIPIKVPQGYQVALNDADYQGYVAPATSAALRTEYFFAGARGPVFSHTFTGETNYKIKDRLATVANIWSPCGDSVNMRVNASMTARGSGMATVEHGLKYHLKYRTCK